MNRFITEDYNNQQRRSNCVALSGVSSSPETPTAQGIKGICDGSCKKRRGPWAHRLSPRVTYSRGTTNFRFCYASSTHEAVGCRNSTKSRLRR